MSDQLVTRQLPTHTQNKRKHHPLSGIRTHDPTVRDSEDISCLRLRGHCDRQIEEYWEPNNDGFKGTKLMHFCTCISAGVSCQLVGPSLIVIRGACLSQREIRGRFETCYCMT
jgi:hypothetical protein